MRSIYLVPAVPALALLATPLLPFLRTTDLWFGLPPAVVWVLVWCVLVTPSLLLVERHIASAETGREGGAS